MNKSFKIKEHTADVSLEANGDNLAEAFSNLGKGMFSIITCPEKISPNQCFDVEVKSTDIEALVVDWLNELLFLNQAEGLMIKKIDITKINEKSIKSTCCGELYNKNKHPIKTEIKAATYYNLSVVKNSGAKIKVTLDV